MQQFLQFTGPAIILLYLIISANFTAEVFGCRLQHYLKNSTIAKHIVGLMTMIFFVVGTADWSQEHDFFKYSGFAISYYVIFLLTTRLPFRFLMSVLFLFTLMYYIEIYKNSAIEIPNKLIIKIALSSDFPQEIAKIRALRGLVFQILSAHQLNLDLQIECSFKASELSPLEKENNLLRLTTAFSVAIISGANGIELKDDYTINSGHYWKKIITNIPIILTEESQLNINTDVIEGAHVLEQMSVKMAHQSWDLFKNIESQGGIIKYAKQGKLLKTAEKEQNIKLDNIKSKNKKIIGFNHFTKDGSDLNYQKDLKIPFELKDLL